MFLTSLYLSSVAVWSMHCVVEWLEVTCSSTDLLVMKWQRGLLPICVVVCAVCSLGCEWVTDILSGSCIGSCGCTQLCLSRSRSKYTPYLQGRVIRFGARILSPLYPAYIFMSYSTPVGCRIWVKSSNTRGKEALFIFLRRSWWLVKFPVVVIFSGLVFVVCNKPLNYLDRIFM